MGNVNQTGGKGSSDETTERLPGDLQDPDQRELDAIPPEDEVDEQEDEQAASSLDGQQESGKGGGAGGGGPTFVGDSNQETVSTEDDEESESILDSLVGVLSPVDDDELDTDGRGIPPSKLESWSKSGPSTSPKQTKDALTRALNNSAHLDRDEIEYRIFLQGSYKNHTNIHGNSDVDVVIQLTNPHRKDSDRFLRETENLFADDRPADYGFDQFKQDVVASLREQYGQDAVVVDDKAIKIKAKDTTLNIDADIVVCQSYHEESGEEAMWFRSESGKTIVNYPQKHFKNGANKNARTGGNYRKTARMFKRARSYLANKGKISKDDVPSYFLSCLLYNVPDEAFVDDPQERYTRVVNYLDQNRDSLSNFVCQHERHPLFGRDSTRWNERDAQRLIDELVWLYQNWYDI